MELTNQTVGDLYLSGSSIASSETLICPVQTGVPFTSSTVP